MSNLALHESSEFYLKAISGSLKGTVFRLSSNEIFIGRDSSNHISIPNDTKMSRKHARFILNDGKYYVQNLSSKNFIKINNEKSNQSELRNNYILTIGDQSFKYIAVSKEKTLAVNKHVEKERKDPGSTEKYHSQQRNKKGVYAVASVLILLTLYVYLDDPHKAEKQSLREIATTEKIMERAETKAKENDEIIEKFESSGRNSKEYKAAHSFYIKGFRAFQKGLYSSALSSFETCLSIYPEHKLAKRYIGLAHNRTEELIAINMFQGQTNLENGKYDFCKSSFKNVMSSINDKTDSRFTEAKQLYNRCRILERNKF